MKRLMIHVAFAAGVLGGGLMVSIPAAAQQQDYGYRPGIGWTHPDLDRSGRGQSGQYNSGRQSRSGGSMDQDQQHRGWSETERSVRDQFEHGYRQGREDERRRRQRTEHPSEGTRSSGISDGSGQETDRYATTAEILPDAPHFEYSRPMEWLIVAAQGLREAIQAMAQQPASQRRDQAINQAQEALRTTRQAMVQLPPELRTR